MLHPDRSFHVRTVRSAFVLALLLTKRVWSTDTGFQLGRHLFLNDSLSAEDRQEYAVIRIDERGGRREQVDALVVTGMSAVAVRRFIRAVVARGDTNDETGEHERGQPNLVERDYGAWHPAPVCSAPQKADEPTILPKP